MTPVTWDRTHGIPGVEAVKWPQGDTCAWVRLASGGLWKIYLDDNYEVSRAERDSWANQWLHLMDLPTHREAVAQLLEIRRLARVLWKEWKRRRMAGAALECDCGHRLPAPAEATERTHLTCRCGRTWVGERDGAHGRWVQR